MTAMPESKPGPALEIVSRTGDAAWAVDVHLRIVAWNGAAAEALGYPQAEVLGRPCHQVIAGRDPGGSSLCGPRCPVMAQIRRGELVRGFDLLAPGRDGVNRRLSVSVIPVADPRSGRLGSLVHLARLAQQGPDWPPPARIRLLGRVTVRRPDSSLVRGPLWRRAKVRGLLAFLALQRGKPVHRDVVIEALWPEMEYGRALHNLNTTVYNLRRSLEPGLRRGSGSMYLRYEGECLVLMGKCHWLDVAAFEDAIARARRESDLDRAEGLYREALGVYRGEFLSELLLRLDVRWCWAEHDRLCDLHLAALEELAGLLERQQREREAAELYGRVLALDPCRETTCRRLMQLCIHRGEGAAAVTHYLHLAKALRGDLNLAPSEETRLLYEAVRAA